MHISKDERRKTKTALIKKKTQTPKQHSGQEIKAFHSYSKRIYPVMDNFSLRPSVKLAGCRSTAWLCITNASYDEETLWQIRLWQIINFSVIALGFIFYPVCAEQHIITSPSLPPPLKVIMYFPSWTKQPCKMHWACISCKFDSIIVKSTANFT